VDYPELAFDHRQPPKWRNRPSLPTSSRPKITTVPLKAHKALVTRWQQRQGEAELHFIWQVMKTDEFLCALMQAIAENLWESANDDDAPQSQ